MTTEARKITPHRCWLFQSSVRRHKLIRRKVCKLVDFNCVQQVLCIGSEDVINIRFENVKALRLLISAIVEFSKLLLKGLEVLCLIVWGARCRGASRKGTDDDTLHGCYECKKEAITLESICSVTSCTKMDTYTRPDVGIAILFRA